MRRQIEAVKASFWQLVFLQSKVNGALYHGEELPGARWEWPKDTFLQRRLQQARSHQGGVKSNLSH